MKLIDIYKKNRNSHGFCFKNEDKFISVLTLWFSYLEYILDYIKYKKADINILQNKMLLKTIFYAPDIIDKFYINYNNKKKLSVKVLEVISKFIPINNGILPGGTGNLKSKIKHKLLDAKLNTIKWCINENFKRDFLNSCIENYGYEKVKYLTYVLPDVFFAYELANNSGLPKVIKGSPFSFLDFYYKYFTLLLQSEKVKLIGVQHGGGYGEWKESTYEAYELRISDEYLGWGFFKNNIIQNRFKIKEKLDVKQQILWVGAGYIYLSDKVDIGNSYINHCNIFSHIYYFKQEFNNYNIKFVPHPRVTHEAYSQVFEKDDYILTKDSLPFLSSSKLVVFDCLSHTLVYFCLQNDIPFVILIKYLPVEDLSESAIAFYKVLKDNNMLFEMDDLDIKSKLKLLYYYMDNNVPFYSPEFIIYKNKTFFSHPSIDKY